MSPGVIVLGSGVIGAAIAYHLALLGLKPVLVDRTRPAEAPSASWASAGGLRSQGRAAAEHALTLDAAARWPTLEDELDADLEAGFGGHLHLAEAEADIAALEARIAADRAGGIAIERVSGAGLGGLAPALSPNALVGAFTPGDGQAHPGRTAEAFAAAAQRLGAVARFGKAARLVEDGGRVAGIVLADGTRLAADLVVLAGGAWSIALLEPLGIVLPLRWRGLQMLLSDVAAPLLRPTVTAVGRKLSLKQLPSGQLMVGGTWFARPEGAAPAATPIDGHVARQWDAAVAVLPAMAGRRLAQVWAGVEAQSIDALPFIGPAPLPGLYVATGFSNHGFQISPAVGAFVARDIAAGGEPRLAPFGLARAGAVGAAQRAAFVAEPYLL